MQESPAGKPPSRRVLRKPLFLALGIAAALLIVLIDARWEVFRVEGKDLGMRPALAAAAAVLMASWWVTEATSIYLTALLPLVLFPAMGIFEVKFAVGIQRSALPYLDAYNFLFLGGMGIAAAMQQWGLHRRIALAILQAIGTGSPRILLGMLLATACISMWISNTATAAMMLPIGMALIAQIEAQTGGRRLELFGGALMLAIAYGANVGGMATKIGTGPNAFFCGFLSREMGREITFLEFLSIGLPFVVLFLPIVWGALWLHGRRDAPRGRLGGEVIRRQLEEMGPLSRGEKVVLAVFLGTAALWISSGPLHDLLEPMLKETYKEEFHLKYESKHTEAGIAMLAMVSLLLIPVGRSQSRGPMALDLRQLRVIPWETLILLGGGFALAEGIEASGLSEWMGGQLRHLREVPALMRFLGVTLVTVYFGAIASNVATATVMLVVLKSAGFDAPLPVMAAATLAASCDFMLPAGTPPNAIVFGSGYITIPRMARTGFLLDLLAAVLVALWGYLGIRWLL